MFAAAVAAPCFVFTVIARVTRVLLAIEALTDPARRLVELRWFQLKLKDHVLDNQTVCLRCAVYFQDDGCCCTVVKLQVAESADFGDVEAWM